MEGLDSPPDYLDWQVACYAIVAVDLALADMACLIQADLAAVIGVDVAALVGMVCLAQVDMIVVADQYV